MGNLKQHRKKKRKQKTITVQLDNKNESLFKRWFKLERIVGIATIISAAVALYLLWPGTKIEILKNKIETKTEIIKSNFHPEKYAKQASNHNDVYLICQFQESVLKYVYDYEQYESLPSLDSYEKSDPTEVMRVFNNSLLLLNQYNTTFLSIIENIDKIQAYGILNKIPSYIPNKAKMQVLIKSGKIREKLTVNNNNKCIEAYDSILKKIDNGNMPSSKEIIKAARPVEDLKEEIDYYQFIYDNLSFFIELNNLYELEIKKYEYNFQKAN